MKLAASCVAASSGRWDSRKRWLAACQSGRFDDLHVGVLQVRSLAESTGEVETATPSLAVQMVGLNSVPTAGDEFYVCADETMARKAAEVAEDAQVSRSLLVFSTALWPLSAVLALC